jgi:ABC-type transporter Mla MlaB component
VKSQVTSYLVPLDAAIATRPIFSMKTSKRKRSPKSEPAVEAALDSAPAAAASAEPAAVEVIASEPANEAVVAEVAVAVEVSEPVAVEAVVAEASEPVVAATTVAPVIVLAANCSVKDAAALKSSLCALANESAAVTLDTSAVERVDTATMQLLCAFVRDRSARNQSVVWRGVSQALNDAVRLLGVAAMLGFAETKGVAA